MPSPMPEPPALTAELVSVRPVPGRGDSDLVLKTSEGTILTLRLAATETDEMVSALGQPEAARGRRTSEPER